MRARTRRVVLGAALALAAPAAQAELTFIPYAAAQYEANSNVLEVSGEREAIARNNDTRLHDSLLRAIGGAELSYALGPQTARLSGEVRRVQYAYFTHLDHTEHSFAGSIDAWFSKTFDGSLGYTEDRRAASFAELDTGVVVLRTDRSGEAMLGINVTPTWRVEAIGQHRVSELPLANDADFKLKETALGTSALWLGMAKIQAGLYSEYVNGSYEGQFGAQDFEEISLQGTMDYEVTGVTAFNFKLGATMRESEGAADRSIDITGSASYDRDLTAKTRFGAQVFRRVDSYTLSANGLVDSGAMFSLSYQATLKIGFGLRTMYMQSEFDAGGQDAGRRDTMLSAGADMTYAPLRWLSLRPYAEYRERDSNLEDPRFQAMLAGVELRARFE